MTTVKQPTNQRVLGITTSAITVIFMKSSGEAEKRLGRRPCRCGQLPQLLRHEQQSEMDRCYSNFFLTLTGVTFAAKELSEFPPSARAIARISNLPSCRRVATRAPKRSPHAPMPKIDEDLIYLYKYCLLSIKRVTETTICKFFNRF